jgi:hypothetical protein
MPPTEGTLAPAEALVGVGLDSRRLHVGSALFRALVDLAQSRQLRYLTWTKPQSSAPDTFERSQGLIMAKRTANRMVRRVFLVLTRQIGSGELLR